MPTRSRQLSARLCIDVWVMCNGWVKRFDVAITSTDTRASDGIAIATGAQARSPGGGKELKDMEYLRGFGHFYNQSGTSHVRPCDGRV